jgi:UDP-3-O-[3-hydroxymyristoyl] glucosamine N-acyltransferase
MISKLLSFRRYPEFVRLAWWRTIVPWRVCRLGVKFAPSVDFLGMPIISMAKGSAIEIGLKTSLCSSSYYTALGVNHPVILRTLSEGATIKIGEETGLSGTTICAAVSVSIGNQCLIGANVTITDTDFHPIKPQNRRHNSNPADIGALPVTISDNVFIGAGSIILKGVSIGKNSVIGAGTVVTKDVPENVIVAGNPAKNLRRLDL